LLIHTDITRLTPEIEIKGVTISPASSVVQDFSQPVTYTVKAEDGSMAAYKVIVKRDNPAGIVYIGSDDKHFYALDAQKGTIKWEFASTASTR
jgi:eukaryotic-like serine/threonine-protein kinase